MKPSAKPFQHHHGLGNGVFVTEALHYDSQLVDLVERNIFTRQRSQEAQVLNAFQIYSQRKKQVIARHPIG